MKVTFTDYIKSLHLFQLEQKKKKSSAKQFCRVNPTSNSCDLLLTYSSFPNTGIYITHIVYCILIVFSYIVYISIYTPYIIQKVYSIRYINFTLTSSWTSLTSQDHHHILTSTYNIISFQVCHEHVILITLYYNHWLMSPGVGSCFPPPSGLPSPLILVY